MKKGTYIVLGVILLVILLIVAFRNKIQAAVGGTGIKIPGATGGTSTNNTPATTGPTPLDYNKLLQEGSKGPEVKELQRITGANTDGIFGPRTKKSLVDYTKAVFGLSYDMITLNDLVLISKGMDPTNASDVGRLPG